MDSRGLLGAAAEVVKDEPGDEELLASLGVDTGENDVAKLVHVRPRAEIKAAEEVARRVPCKDFDAFRPVFEQVQRELESGERKTSRYGGKDAEIEQGDFFILEGQKLLIVEMGDKFISEYDRANRKLRVIYDNGTESRPLLRSVLLYNQMTRHLLAGNPRLIETRYPLLIPARCKRFRPICVIPPEGVVVVAGIRNLKAHKTSAHTPAPFKKCLVSD